MKYEVNMAVVLASSFHSFELETALLSDSNYCLPLLLA